MANQYISTHRQKTKEARQGFPHMGLCRQPGHWWRHLATLVRVGLIQLRDPWSQNSGCMDVPIQNHNIFPRLPGLPEAATCKKKEK